tara:strand:- start:652 stop:804 length:153 start_codon:yes stop_codon:yes gene_type:complete
VANILGNLCSVFEHQKKLLKRAYVVEFISSFYGAMGTLLLKKLAHNWAKM